MLLNVSRTGLGWLLGPCALHCAMRDHHPHSPTVAPSRFAISPLEATKRTEAQAAAIERFVSLCRDAKISRLQIDRGAEVLAALTLDPRASALCDTMSVTKAIAGLVMGCLLEKDKSAQTIPLSTFATSSDLFSRISLSDVLHHTTTLRLKVEDEVGEIYRAKNIIELTRHAQLTGQPGAQIRYSNLAVNLLNSAVKSISGLSLKSFTQTELFLPLDISDFFWEEDEDGNQYVMAGLHLQVQDLAKIGSLLFSKGRYKGRQVVPEAWIDGLWKPTAMVHQDAIGERVSWASLWAQTYVAKVATETSGLPMYPPDSVSASGFGGQFIVALRRSQLIIVTQRDMELDDTPPYLGGQDFSDSLDELEHAFALTPE